MIAYHQIAEMYAAAGGCVQYSAPCC
eukprot:COSAG03_NODE_7821_length_869_cov_1.454545_1_plen_25_part_10